MRHFLFRLEKNSEFWWIFGLSFLFFLLRFPSLFEPYWYGDEGIYQTIGHALNNGRLLYSEIWDNKTPLLYYFYSFFGPEQTSMRLLSLIFGIISIPFFFLLAKNLFQRKKSALVSTTIFTLLFGLPILEGNIANAENFLLLPIVASFYLFSKILIADEINRKNYRPFLLGGLLLGIAFLLKTVAFFDFLAILLIFIFFTFPSTLNLTSARKFLSIYKKNLLFIMLGFVLPFAFSLIFFLFQGSLAEYLQAALFNNLGYIGVENTVLIAVLKTILLIISISLLFYFRKRFSPSILFILIWLALSLFNSFFSQRPYTHYLLVLLPSFSLLTGLLITRNRRQKRLVLYSIIAIILISHLFFRHWSILKTLLYYPNFISYLSTQKTFSDYASFFDSRTPRDIDLATFLNSKVKEDENIFFWGDNAQMYYLTKKLPPGRFTVAYHLLNKPDAVKETKKDFEEMQPKYVVIFPEVPTFPYPMYNYAQSMNIQGATIYERIY